MSLDPVSSTPRQPDLQAFAQAAEAGKDAYLTVSGGQLRVLATGATPSGSPVAWVEPDDATASLFANALARTYGRGIASAVTAELGLAPGQALSSATVMRALDMADTSRQALEGVDFSLRMDCLATTGSAAFRSTCAQAGIAPESLGANQCRAIDQAMQRRFEQAASTGNSPVPRDTALHWLSELVRANAT